MNILMILSNPFTHDPRVSNEAKSLIKAGHKVTVLAWDKGKKNNAIDQIDGINVVRSYNTKFMNMLPYDIFRLHFWWRKGFKDAIKLQEKNNFDIVHCHDLDTLPIGIKLKKKLGIPLIYDAHEIWGYMVARDLPKIWSNYYLWKEKHIIKHVDNIITVNDPLKNYFESICNIPITIVMNCKPFQEEDYQTPNNERFTLLYIGSLSKSRFMLEIVDVVKEIPEIYCIIGGRGKTEYVSSLKQKCSAVNNVDFIGLVQMDKVLTMTKQADAVICMTSPMDPNNSRASANKQFEALVCGRPIICTKNTYPGIFTEKTKCGLVAKFNKEDLKRAILELKNNPKLCEEFGKNALNAAKEKYNWSFQEKKLIEVYKGIK